MTYHFLNFILAWQYWNTIFSIECLSWHNGISVWDGLHIKNYKGVQGPSQTGRNDNIDIEETFWSDRKGSDIWILLKLSRTLTTQDNGMQVQGAPSSLLTLNA